MASGIRRRIRVCARITLAIRPRPIGPKGPSTLLESMSGAASLKRRRKRLKACYDYRRDFLALVDQTVEFARLQCEMGATAAEVTNLAQTNVRDAEREIQERPGVSRIPRRKALVRCRGSRVSQPCSV